MKPLNNVRTLPEAFIRQSVALSGTPQIAARSCLKERDIGVVFPEKTGKAARTPRYMMSRPQGGALRSFAHVTQETVSSHSACANKGVSKMQHLQILHLEDDVLDADLVQREVARLDVAPTWVTASSAEEFFDAMASGRFDAVLSDHRVPGIDGLQALQVVREQRQDMPFIFISGNADPRWAEYCIEAGATDYVPKDQLWRLPSALQPLHAARERERLAALTRGRALLIDIVKELSLARSTDAIVDIVRRGARRLNNADGATVVLRDDDKCHYIAEDAIGPLWSGLKFPLTSCISGWAM